MADVDTSDPPPKELDCTLLAHQKLGLHWLKDREKGKKRGGILADDASPTQLGVLALCKR